MVMLSLKLDMIVDICYSYFELLVLDYLVSYTLKWYILKA